MTTGLKKLTALLLGSPLALVPLACTGDDGAQGPPGLVAIDATTASDDVLEGLDVVSEITSITITSPPVVRFTLKTAQDVPIIGIVPFWNDSNRFVRFTLTKLVPGANGDPDSWVAYVRDAGEPDYDTGSTLVDHRDGSYTFTFNTDVRTVPGVAFEPTLTHRVAGQIGSGSVPLEAQNLWLDFVPTGAPVTRTRNIAVMDSCNECHDDLVFHGRRFETQYCVQCHNQDLAMGEGDFSFMIHRIHAGGTFNVLDGGVDYSEVTYPQDLMNCRKCHNAADPETPEADNWMALPNIQACDGCHNNFSTMSHSGPNVTTNESCELCHGPGMAEAVLEAHTTPNATPNNPELFPGQRDIAYELLDAEVDGGTNDVTVRFRIMSDGAPLDVTNLPADLADMAMEGFRYPDLLLAWAMPQDGIAEPADYNNLDPMNPRRSAQPISLSMDEFMPIEMGAPVGQLVYDPMDGVTTATITDAASQFPVGATMRAVAIQNYLQQDLSSPLDGISDVSLHAISPVVAVTGDSARREVVDSTSCSSCHEWFEGHGGNRVFGYGSDFVCALCHVPNLSSSGRAVVDPTSRSLDADIAAAVMAGTLDPMVDPNDPLTYPEDSQNFRDLIHGIHSSGFRDQAFQFVRGPSRQGYYDWDHVTFPRGASTSNCNLCHLEGTYELPLDGDLLATTVRTTGVNDGQDLDTAAVEAALLGVPNDTDWVNTPTASSCYFCHNSVDAWAHMSANGALVSNPVVGAEPQSNRDLLASAYESCAVCHGPGRIADLDLVHNK